MRYCMICGEALSDTERECPNCHTPVRDASTTISTPVRPFVGAVQNNVTAAETETRYVNADAPGAVCPRCGETLMPGVNVCEVCGEVIAPKVDTDTRQTTVAAPTPPPYTPSDYPGAISATNAINNRATQKFSVPPSTYIPEDRPTYNQRSGKGAVSVGVLAIICVAIAVIAAVITWAVIHFSNNDKENDTSEAETYITAAADDADNADYNYDAGVELPEPKPLPAAETVKVQDGDDVPIEGMRESLAGSWTFYGKINNKYSIGIDMKIEPDGSISGCYWYDKVLRENGDKPSTYINIEGEVDDTGKVKLSAFQFGENRPSEHWIGKLSGEIPLRFNGTLKAKGTTYTFKTTTRK